MVSGRYIELSLGLNCGVRLPHAGVPPTPLLASEPQLCFSLRLWPVCHHRGHRERAGDIHERKL